MSPIAEILQTSYVISMDGSGNPIIINDVRNDFICYHDNGESELLADSIETLIEDHFYEWRKEDFM
ncbi:hypothetical protein [Paenibacillus macquariensis]|uniref:hypothetical protein n=1 Tax=Paenibacillus macquariensis TaxID=948756 RepID=UPI0007C3BDDA|nr:hypothetical protein [Paenibacillus macquariensis]MEC0090857.1 hypothetical protein [Paenibacillus macquariensis]OAB34591.1 hypothetical protein PMSM_12085 [Paenibacillus macquariensis subsp. macquariensis]